MKKILWTTLFWLIVFFGFILYVKLFNANMSSDLSAWFATTSTSGIIGTTGTQNDVMAGITSLQTTLTDMQTKLDTLVGATPALTPIILPTIVPTVTVTTGTQ